MSASSNEDVVNMVEVLEDQQRLEKEATAVLGASDDTTCSYAQGYVKRQALYACLTCARDTSAPGGGICLACSYACHDGHDLVELYTKRNFRCDCGNSLFLPEHKCCLMPDKAAVNALNKYDHNFSGRYCSCEQLMNGTETDQSESIFQCVICEDWFHGRHLGTAEPEAHAYSDVACAACAIKCPYLKRFEVPYWLRTLWSDEDSSDEETDGGHEIIYCHTAATKKAVGIPKLLPPTSAIFLVHGWRERLCQCAACLRSYDEQGVAFLVDPEDKLEAYESRATDLRQPDVQILATRYFNNMSAPAQYGVVEEFCKMKDELKEYLRKFAENGKVVREEDVKEFFEGLKSNKRRRLE